MLAYLFGAVADGEIGRAYMLAGLSSAVWLIGQVFRYNAYYCNPIISSRMRAGLILLLFAKVSKLTSFVASSAEVGKVINLLSSDFNSIENKLPFLMAGSMFPLALIGGTIIICLRMGWAGIFTLVVPLIAFPIALFITKKTKDLILRVNISKDSRIKLCS